MLQNLLKSVQALNMLSKFVFVLYLYSIIIKIKQLEKRKSEEKWPKKPNCFKQNKLIVLTYFFYSSLAVNVSIFNP